MKCDDCGEGGATYRPCPCALEINDYLNMLWLCDECHHERAMDI